MALRDSFPSMPTMEKLSYRSHSSDYLEYCWSTVHVGRCFVVFLISMKKWEERPYLSSRWKKASFFASNSDNNP